MIQFENVTKAYGGEAVLEQVSFTIGKKEKCALIGRNGAGKTTLFRLILGHEEQDSGTIAMPKQYRLGYLHQHISFSAQTILEEACLALTNKDETYRAEAILFGLGFCEKDLLKQPTVLSGGYSLRLHLTKLLLSEPDCLLLDEPTNYLDIVSIGWLTQFLKKWPHELIMISHDRRFLDAISTHTMAIHRKTVKKTEGGCEKLYTQIAQDEEVYEKTRAGLEKKRKHLQSFIDRFGAKNTKAAQAQSRAKAISRMPQLDALCQLADLNFAFPSLQTASKVLMRLNAISFSYTDTPLITNVSFEIERLDRIGIIGKNGKGKSTLLKLITGELKPHTGDAWTISGIRIGYFGQSHIDRLHKEHTIEQEIGFANPELSQQEIRAIAGKMHFPQNACEKKIGVLSGGERSRIVLAKLLAKSCHLLVLDEPTNHLDIESMESFMDALDTFEGAVMIVSHSELVLERVAQKLIVFQNSDQTQFLGTYSEFLQRGGWEDDEKAPVRKESSFKEEKRLRAERVTQRAKAIKPYMTKIAELESAIMALEGEVAKLNEQLIVTFAADLAKAHKEKQERIEVFFSELEKTHSELQATEAQFHLIQDVTSSHQTKENLY